MTIAAKILLTYAILSCVAALTYVARFIQLNNIDPSELSPENADIVDRNNAIVEESGLLNVSIAVALIWPSLLKTKVQGFFATAEEEE